jgi:GT2 family glycosyltransferase
VFESKRKRNSLEIASDLGPSPSSHTPFVSVIVVNYNGGRWLKECLRSLLEDSYVAREIIIVDNGSSDDSPRILNEVRTRHPEVTVLSSPANLGYAGAVNLALGSAIGVYVAVMNMDVTVERGWLAPLIAHLECDPGAGAVNPLILLADGKRINTAGLDVHVTGLGFTRRLGRSVQSVGRLPVRVPGLSGAAFVIRRSLLDRIGGMHAGGFLYHEDVNLSWLLQLMGWKLYCVPESVVRHDYFLTMYPSKLYLLERNRWAMLLAYMHRRTLLLLMPMLLVTEIVMWCYCILRGWAVVRAKVASYRWVLAQRELIEQPRRLAESVRLMSDWQILRRLRWSYAWDQFLALGRERGGLERRKVNPLPEEVVDG